MINNIMFSPGGTRRQPSPPPGDSAGRSPDLLHYAGHVREAYSLHVHRAGLAQGGGLLSHVWCSYAQDLEVRVAESSLKMH